MMNRIVNCLKRKWLPVSIALVLVFGLTACGKSQDGEASETPEWVYVPEFLDFNDVENISWYRTVLAGDDFCYISETWDEETSSFSTALCKHSILDGSGVTIPLTMEGNASVNSWVIGEDGSFYVALSTWNYDESTGEYSSGNYLVKYDGAGEQIFLKDLSEALSGEYAYISSIAADGQGRVYLRTDEGILLYDNNGNHAGSVTVSRMSGYINGMGAGNDGKVYVVINNYGDSGISTTLSEVIFETKSLGEGYSDYPGGNVIVQDEDGTFLAYDSVSVYRYDPQTKQKEKLFDWLDADINGTNVQNLGILSDGRIAATYQDWENNDSGVALLNKVSAAEAPQKQQIVIGAMYSSGDLQAAAVRFNKSSDTYHVTIRQYMDSNSWSADAYTDAIARMNSEITSDNCPDIIDLSSVDMSQMAEKGVFEDLNPYLEKSSVLSRGNMIESVLNAYTYGDKLVAIPNTFSLQTLIGSTEQVGEEMGWTLEEMIAFADAHPEADLFDRISKASILDYCLTYNMDSFVDWKTGNCYFDTPEFKSLLQFVARFDDEVRWEEGQMSEPERIQAGQVLLTMARISQLDEMQLYIEMFQGDITAIGYPNTDGSSGCILSAEGCYAISSKSQVKDGAWAFIENYLTSENTRYRWGFPNNRSELDRMVEEAVKEEYLTDENGEYILNERGERIPIQGGHGIGWGNWFYDYRIPTREEVDMVLELMEVAKPMSPGNAQILTLITEDAEAFFQGQKPVDEVTRIIQSRVSIYVEENR